MYSCFIFTLFIKVHPHLAIQSQTLRHAPALQIFLCCLFLKTDGRILGRSITLKNPKFCQKQIPGLLWGELLNNCFFFLLLWETHVPLDWSVPTITQSKPVEPIYADKWRVCYVCRPIMFAFSVPVLGSVVESWAEEDHVTTKLTKQDLCEHNCFRNTAPSKRPVMKLYKSTGIRVPLKPFCYSLTWGHVVRVSLAEPQHISYYKPTMSGSFQQNHTKQNALFYLKLNSATTWLWRWPIMSTIFYNQHTPSHNTELYSQNTRFDRVGHYCLQLY